MEATMIKKEYILEGLCCGNCASKIEKEIGGLDGVSGAAVDFVSKTLTMEITDRERLDSLVAQAGSIIKRHDSDITMNEKEIPVTGRKVIYFLGLGCADCARKIEERVRGIDGVKAADLDFVLQKLTIEAFDKRRLPAIAKRASQIALDTEPGIEISYTDKRAAQEASGSRKRLLKRALLFGGAAIFLAGMLLELPRPVELILFLAAYLAVGGEVVLRALKNISKGRVFDENFLMSAATIGAFAIGEYPEGVAVMLFYQVGEAFQRMAVNRSRKSIAALMDIRPDFANLKAGDEIIRVVPEEVCVGDLIVVKPGEKIPLDGKVVEGKSSLDTSALTGEALPRDVEPGDEVLSGAINKNGLLTVEVSREFGESTVSRILDLVQNASGRKAPTENFITKFAGYYTPFVVFAALALAVVPPLVVPGALFADWINRALVFLVVSCPCALVISIPLSFFGGIGSASKRGILVKGSNYLEALNNVDTVVFDKTGTLTKGTFKVTRIEGANGWTEDGLLSYAAHAEGYSNHPIAVSIQKAYGQEVDSRRIAEYEEVSGQGIRAGVDGKKVLAGNGKLLRAEGVPCEETDASGTVVYFAIDGVFAGYIVISDELKPDSKQAVKELKSLGVGHIAMLTGDSRSAGDEVARETGLDEAFTGLLPHQKVEKLEELERRKATNGKLVFVGDGINDAPVLARSDVGVAMGGLGSDAAIEAADVVLMTDEPSKLATAIRIAKKTRVIVWQNIVFALGVKAIILVLGALGVATMWEAVFGDVGVAVIAIFNAMRAMRVSPANGGAAGQAL
jgi:Cd2+/Zn2+-exporting ATPase